MLRSLYTLFSPEPVEDHLQVKFKYVLFRKDLPIIHFSKQDFSTRATTETYICKNLNELSAAYQNILNYVHYLKQPDDIYNLKLLIKIKGSMDSEEIDKVFDTLEDFKAYLVIYAMTKDWLNHNSVLMKK